MKPVFKCDHCSEIGTEEEIREHEEKYPDNYDRRSCETCIHKIMKFKDKQFYYECKIGKEIPKGKIFVSCPSYERKEKNENPLEDLFGVMFGR